MSLPSVDLAKHAGCNGVRDACMSGKQSSGPFKSIGHTYSKPLEMVHSDLMGAIRTKTYDGESYALCIIDEYTKYSAFVLLKSKNNASKEFIAVIKQWE